MKYSFVVPIYNDGVLAEAFCREMEKVFRDYEGVTDLRDILEVVFVDDGSSNDSPRLLKSVCDKFPFARAALLARNVGQHAAISAGYRIARGNYVGMLNVDQEDPPSQLPLLIDELKKDTADEFDIAGGLYNRREGVGYFTNLTSRLFHTLFNKLTGFDTPIHSSTSRVMKRRAVDTYNGLKEKARYLPGLEMWLGFRYVRVPIRYQPRKEGESSYNFRRRLRLAIDSVLSFSDFPLRLAVKFGLGVAALGMLSAIALVIDRLFLRSYLPGYLSTLSAIVFFGGVQTLVTGVASLYVGRILVEVKGRPLYIVRETYEGRGVSNIVEASDEHDTSD